MPTFNQVRTPWSRKVTRTTRRWIAVACGVACLVAGQSSALAQADEGTAVEQPALAAPQPSASADGVTQADAVAHYQRGREHYLAGRYHEALTELKAALALDPKSPNLVYNVARVNEDLGNLDDAISSYQRYLELLPPNQHSERDKTEKTLRRLEGAKEEVAAQRSAADLKGFGPNTTPPPAAPTYGRTDPLFWTAAVGGTVLIVAGGVTGLLALQRQHDVSRFVVGPGGTFAQRKSLVSQTKHLALASDLCFATAGAALIGAALRYFLRAPEGVPADGDAAADAGKLSVNLDVAPGAALLRMQGRR